MTTKTAALKPKKRKLEILVDGKPIDAINIEDACKIVDEEISKEETDTARVLCYFRDKSGKAVVVSQAINGAKLLSDYEGYAYKHGAYVLDIQFEKD